MSAWERESGELPAPNLPPFGRKTGRGLFVVPIVLPRSGELAFAANHFAVVHGSIYPCHP